MKHHAFTLLELLFVMVIIGIVVGVTLPAFNSLGKAQSLSSAGNNFLDQLAQARQAAVAQNRAVEVRLYKRRENPALPVDANSNPERFRSFRTMISDDPIYDATKKEWVSLPVALSTLLDLPTRVVLSEEQTYSTLLFAYTNTTPPRALLTEDLSPTEKNVSYQVIRFKPTGGTDLSTTGTPDGDKWFLTIKSDNDPKVTVPSPRPANNYFTVMLDPVSGRARAYRP